LSKFNISIKKEKKMKYFSKLPAFLMVMTIMVSAAYSDYYDQPDQQCQPKPEQCPPVRCCDPVKKPTQDGYNTPGRINVCGAWDFFLKADFIYWEVKRDLTEYAVSTTNSYTNPALSGKVIRPSAKWRPGVKVALGGNSDHDDWTFLAEWTYILGKADGSATAPANGALLPVNQTTLEVFDRVSANNQNSRIKIHYHTGDLNLGRPYYVGKDLVFAPFFGLRGAWIKDKERVSSETLLALQFDGSTTTAIANLTESTKQRNWYIGPRIGIDTKWELGAGFRLFGNAAGSILYTRGYISTKATSDDYASTLGYTGNTVMSLKTDKHNQLRPNANTAVGLAWGSYFDKNNWHVDMVLGYEFHYWFDHITSLSSGLQGENNYGGGLYLQGATFSLQLDF
jgi:hypothetical protein